MLCVVIKIVDHLRESALYKPVKWILMVNSFFLLCLYSIHINAAQKTDINDFISSGIVLKSIDSSETKNLNVGMSYNIDPYSTLKIIDKKIIGDKSIVYFGQYYLDYIVDGVSVILVKSGRHGVRWIGSIYTDIHEDIAHRPVFESLTSGALQDVIMQKKYPLPAYDYNIDNFKYEKVISINQEQSANILYKASYRMVFTDSHQIKLPLFYINPYNQSIVKETNRTRNDRAAGSGPGGNPKIGQIHYNYAADVLNKMAKSLNTFIINKNVNKCTMNADGVQTINLAGTTSGDTIYTYDCDNASNSDNTNDMSEFTASHWIEGYTPINDAHFHGQLVFEMYQGFSMADSTVLKGDFKADLVHGPFSEGEPIKLRVHYDQFWGNANWDGTYVNIGDGYDTFYPMVSLDIISHEVAHGFMEKHNTNFVYGDNEPSGSIAESFADIAGEAAEYFYKGSNDWLHNQEGFRGATDEAGRYFADPTQDGKSIASLRDYWSGVTTRHGSGLFNKAFYHLVTDNAEWNTLTGYQLFMVAASNYWTGNVDFVDAAHGVVLAVEDLDTSKSSFNGASVTKLQAQVITAFAQVDIYTPSVHENYALLDYEINFNELSLINKSGTQANATDWQWSISREDGSDERTISIESGQEFKRQQIDLEKGIYRVTLSFMGNDSQIYQYSKKVEMGADYCAANVGSSITGYISQVSIDGQTVTGETAADNYADYSGSEYAPFQLASTTASITLTPSADSSRQSWSVWIDNNGDGDFLDEGEWLLKGHSSKEAITENIMIPNTPNVIKRLRVAQNYSGYPRPECAYIASGEVEDYSIVLVGNEMPSIAFEAEAYRVVEGDELVIKVIRTGNLFNTQNLAIEVINGSAINGEDFNFVKSDVEFLQGESEKTIKVEVLNDEINENAESFTMSLKLTEDDAVISETSTNIIIINKEFDKKIPGNSGSLFWLLFVVVIVMIRTKLYKPICD